MTIDVQALKSRLPIAELIQRHGIELKHEGPDELRGLCPFHVEQTPSFTVTISKDQYFCFGCGQGGDQITFLQRWHSLGDDFKAAADKLQEMVGGVVNDSAAPQRQQPAPRPRDAWLPLLPAPSDAPPLMDGERTVEIHNPKRAGERSEWTRYTPQELYPYTNTDGELLGYVLRVMIRGKKITPTVTYCQHTETGKRCWALVSFPEPRPLYGLPRLAALPGQNVVIPEGEKARDAAERLLPKFPCLTWPGGGKGIRFVDWSPLAGRKVLLLRDNDAPGIAAMEGYYKESGEFVPGIAQLLSALDPPAEVRIVDPPPDKPDGWDVADEPDWATADAVAYIKTGMREPRQPAAPEKKTAAVAQASAEPEPAQAPPADEPPPDFDEPPPADYGCAPPVDDEPDPFRQLGFQKNTQGTLTHHYMPRGSNQVIALAANGHTKNNLLELAPLQWWENVYPAKNGCDWDMAANALIQRSKRIGIFDPDRIRGRGAWWDDGRPAVHLGDSVIIGGHRYNVEDVPSRYIYETASKLPVELDRPLSPSEAHELVKICEALPWEKPVYGTLLAGWITCATICGALRWRPHVWVTGPAGSGKSTCMEIVIARSLGSMVLSVLGETSEAGIRQKLQHDALPVIFDEAETERKQSAMRMENVMALVTQASSDSGAEIIKGTAGGKALTFRIRSMFAFSSIGIQMKQHSTRTRVTVLSMFRDIRPGAEDRYNDLLRMIDDTLTDEWISRLHARAISMIPVIRQNAEVFSSAGAAILGQKRIGDQIGALLAGAYALHSNKVITRADAEHWITERDWSETAALDEMNDERSCLAYIAEHVLRLPGGHDRSIGELVMVASGEEMDAADFTTREADRALRRLGIRTSDDRMHVMISNTHSGIASILANTAWSASWGKVLKRIAGAQASDKPVRFGSGSTQRATVLPLRLFLGED